MTMDDRKTIFENDDRDWGPITPRTRFMVWRALRILYLALDIDLSTWPPDMHEAVAIPDYPRFTHGQSKEWWIETQKAVDRMSERMRTGLQWNPRTPAEEAALYIATGEHYVEAAQDELDTIPGIREQFDALPNLGESDFDYREVVPSLTGDVDIELIFRSSLDGLGDSEDEVNAAHGIGDYRAESWHETFDIFHDEPDLPSSFL